MCDKATVVTAAARTRTRFKEESLLVDDCSYWAGSDQNNANIILDMGCVVAIDR